RQGVARAHPARRPGLGDRRLPVLCRAGSGLGRPGAACSAAPLSGLKRSGWVLSAGQCATMGHLPPTDLPVTQPTEASHPVPQHDTHKDYRRVIVESPYAGDVETHVAYARAALRDCLSRGEAPIASHLL